MTDQKRRPAIFAFGATEEQSKLNRDMVYYRLAASGLLQHADAPAADPDLEALRKNVRGIRDQHRDNPSTGISRRVIKKLAGTEPK